MGADLAKASPRAQAVFDEADHVLGFSLSRLCFSGPETELTLTANTQPALLTTSTAVAAALVEKYPDLPAPAAAAGHSLGEYSALVASGALSFEAALKLVRLRGLAMQSAVPAGQGAMLAIIGSTEADVEQLCNDARGAEVLSPANFNCPGQIVIAGHAAAIERAKGLAAERKAKAIPLKVSAPFHCALMAPAAKQVQEALVGVSTHPMRFPVVANVDAAPNHDPSRVAELLVRQIDGAVRWEQTLRWLVAEGITHALELGPEKVLAGLAKKTDKELKVLSVGDLASLEQVPAFLAS